MKRDDDMDKFLSRRRRVWFPLFLLTISLYACAAGVSRMVVRSVPGSQNVPIRAISATAVQSLAYLGYSIRNQNLETGDIYASKPVGEDLYGRDVAMKVKVMSGPTGEKRLAVEAFSCPGCVPQATFDPAWMADRFFTAFDQFAGRAELDERDLSSEQEFAGFFEQTKTPQPAVHDERTRRFKAAETERKVQMGVTIENVTPETAASLELKEARGTIIRQIAPGSPASRTNLKSGDVIVEVDGKPVADTMDVILGISQKSPGDTVSLTVSRAGRAYHQPVTLESRTDGKAVESSASLPPLPGEGPADRRSLTVERKAEADTVKKPSVSNPSIQITRLAVNPPAVPPGGKFDVVVEYSAEDSTTQQQQITVKLTIEILQGQKVLYTHQPIEVRGANGGSTKRTEPLAGSKKAGTYTVRATVKYQSSRATQQVDFSIQ